MDLRIAVFVALCIFGAGAVQLTGDFGSPLLGKLREALEDGGGDFPVLENLYRRAGDSENPILDKVREKGLQGGFPMLRRIAQNFPGMVPALLGAGIHCHNGSVNCGKSVTRHVYLGPGAAGLLPALESKVVENRDRLFGPIVCAPGTEDCGFSMTYNLYPGKISKSNVGIGNDERTYVFAGHLSALHTEDVENLYDLVHRYKGKDFFHKEFIQAVCQEAGKHCVAIYDDSFRCFTHGESSGPRPGTGLLSRSYDACIAWAITPARKAMMGFTTPYLQLHSPKGNFYVKEGNPEGFDPADLTTTSNKIALINTFAHYGFHGLKLNKDLKGSGHEFTQDRVHMVSTRREFWRVIYKGEVTAGFAPKILMDLIQTPGIETIGDPIECAMNDDHTTDVAIMTRKDSSLLDWWDHAFERVKRSGKFYEICQKYEEDIDNLIKASPEPTSQALTVLLI
ncbi:uncharacterized protein LOC144452053 [Glandiceps talaboti]